MGSVLNHDLPKSNAEVVNVNVAMLTLAEKKVLQNSPAREIAGGMVRLPQNKKHAKLAAHVKALGNANNSPATRSKGRSYGGGVSTIVF